MINDGSRLKTVWFHSCTLCFVIVLFALDGVAQEQPKVNIIFLMTDDQASYSLGCYGNSDVQTPHIDQLAAQGVVFDRHYTTTAICMGSRATVMTGLYEHRHGCNFDRGPLMNEHWQQSYPILLRRAGYRTAFAGKFGFEVKMDSETKPTLPSDDFDRWGGGPGQTSFRTANNPSMKSYADKYPHATRSYGAFGADFIRDSAKQNQPFCLSISFKAPHRPVQPDPVFDDVYLDKVFKKPANYGREFGEHFSLQSRQGRQYERFESWGYRDQYDQVMASYHQLVYAVDVAVGMMTQAVEDAGIASHTVIIFTSDNGYFCGSHGYGSKVLPYEEASRVPMIIFDPRHPNSGKKMRSKAVTGTIDCAPTILDLAGIEIPEGLDGRSLLPLYEKPTGRIHSSLQLINVWGPEACHSLSVLTEHHKYIYWPWETGDFEPTEELYNITRDPLELKNLSDMKEDVSTMKRLRKVYDQDVADWKKRAVDRHGYAPYGDIFDRRIPWN